MSRLISSGANLQTPLKTLQGITYKQAHKVWEASFLQSLLLFLTLFTGPIIAFFPF